MSFKEISDDQFEKDFKPLQNTIDKNAAFGGQMWETYGDEFEYVKKVHKETPDKVWTIVSDETTAYINGLHFVNRLGYIITEVGLNEHPEYAGVKSVNVFDPDDLPAANVKEYAERLAEDNGVDLDEIEPDEINSIYAGLNRDSTTPQDDTESLLVALYIENIIDDEDELNDKLTEHQEEVARSKSQPSI